MYVGRALYLKGYEAHLIMAVWSGIPQHCISARWFWLLSGEYNQISNLPFYFRKTSVSVCVVALFVSGLDFQSQLIL